MRFRQYQRLLAAALAAAMLMMAVPAQAAEGTAGEITTAAAAALSIDPDSVVTAYDGQGQEKALSAQVRELLKAGSIYYDQADGYLKDAKTDGKVDPESGEAIPETDGGSSADGSQAEADGAAADGSNTGTAAADGTGTENSSDSSGEAGAEDAEDVPQIPEQELSDAAASEYDSNEALVAAQQIVSIPEVKEDFRFWTVSRNYAFARNDLQILEEKSDAARAVGTLAGRGLCYLLKDEGDGWYYVESGSVRGFIRTEKLYTGKQARQILKTYEKEDKEQARLEGRDRRIETKIQKLAPVASETVAPAENAAFAYLRATVEETVVEKNYAIAAEGSWDVREGAGSENRTVGTLSGGDLCYILADETKDWVYIESGDVRGFVEQAALMTGDETDAYVEETGEDQLGTAKETVEPEDNQACYYTLTSIKSGVPSGEVRQALLEYAVQFVGNPYVWGGVSLTEGADCSGFVQTIYKDYGYELPRTAEAQSQCGTKIPVSEAEPGDLIFYAKDGYVYHVVIYAGDGQTIEAANAERGITAGTVYEQDAVWAVRLIEDRQYLCSGDVGEVNATEDMYGDLLGNFKLTYYCACEECCDKETGITATGAPVVEGETIAVDPSVIPYGTKVIINGHVFTAEDCGGAIKGNRIDIYVNSHEKAQALGVGSADVYLVR